ncbi:MAG: hypothetical protein Q7S58_00790 [Candidatus Binatus sp.]|uniref:hypothetical protein n=1 Tax=Candidatus Binatus sp. TaxID=2811406 RepID=UPI00271C59C0|nr:hypothetical protein [Candidatus Binatus sp.]MDO8430923.1 hypothetical protein [Candidatus Binatus sp.]
MKRIIVGAGAILIVIAWFLGARQASANIDDQAQIKSLEDQLEKAVDARDIDGSPASAETACAGFPRSRR